MQSQKESSLWQRHGKVIRYSLTAFTTLVLLSPTRGWTQSNQSLQQEIKALKEGQQAIQKDLQEIKTLLRNARGGGAPAAPQNVVLNIDGGQIHGEKDAKVTLVEYTDFQCPFCGKYVHETFPQIEEEYIKTGKVKYVRKDFPLESIHPNAFKAAEATRCAQEQGKGWEMHARLFNNQQQLAAANLPQHAQEVGLDTTAFQQCLDSGKYAALIRKDMSEAQGAGVTGTPSFFLGLSDANGTVKATRALAGAQAYSTFKAVIDELLAEKQ
jgi:protein-disulfide isomerase